MFRFIDIMYQPVSVRGDIMMHHKAVLTLMDGAENEKDSEKVVGWAYMGSHNLTQAAWGNISLSKSGGDPQVSPRVCTKEDFFANIRFLISAALETGS